MAVVAQIRVLYADTDQMGVVNNVVYLRWFEVGRAEWIRGHGGSYREIEASGYRLPVIEAHLKYKEPARYDELVAVECGPEEIRAASVRFWYKLRRAGDGALLCEGWTVHACIDTEGKLRRFPDELLALLRPER